ncbi:sugar phosphate isomerase/epimerase family protein [Saccharopolyspora griseoalba]|uniref:Sugar phosphate isomerase/epimerase family protein n=1 Tax=Saccharopolyspora griseoalba TaxID=1431848 RepID=A0ABW2LED0_9PSEU
MLSVQLYSVRDLLSADQPGTLARLAEIGYRHVEPFGLGALHESHDERLVRARRLRRDLDAAGLGVSAVHAALPDAEQLAEECEIVGADTAFVPHPRQVPGFDAETFDDPGRLDAFADAIGAAVEAVDLRLGYHNHWFEWAVLPDGTTAFDRFWSRAHRDLLAELDVYWAVAAGADPGRELAELGSRAVSVHLKDGPAEVGAAQVPLGSGELDIPSVLREVSEVPWHVAEIDTTEHDPFALLQHNASVLTGSGTKAS